MNNLGIVIEREYRERVAKKSFLITTLLMPVLMLMLMVAPSAMLFFGGQSQSDILVIDNSGVIVPHLKSDENVRYTATSSISVDSALRRDDCTGVLVIPRDVVEAENAKVRLFTNGPSSISLEENITGQINSTIEDIRLRQYNIDNLSEILDKVHSEIVLSSKRNDKESDEESSAGLSFGLGILLTFVLYMFLLIYGQMVMTSIIEEKGNRVLELVVSSVKPSQLMMGKIVGVALVALTQIVIWTVLMGAMITFVLPAVIPPELAADIASANAGNLDAVSSDIDLVKAFAMFGNIGYMMGIMFVLMLFLVFGFLLYSALFAAIGSAIDNIQDASQLTTIITIPIILGLIFSFQAANDPMGPVAFWLSMFPLTSPMVMMARVPFGIPAWEIVLSIAILIVSTLFIIWMAGKIYRVGIFMYGKKPNLKELMRWVKYK
mgnify:FL=1